MSYRSAPNPRCCSHIEYLCEDCQQLAGVVISDDDHLENEEDLTPLDDGEPLIAPVINWQEPFHYREQREANSRTAANATSNSTFNNETSKNFAGLRFPEADALLNFGAIVDDDDPLISPEIQW